MPLLLHEELGDVDGVEELRERRVDGDDDLPDGGRGLVGDGVVAVVDAADGAPLEDHVVLRQGARLITEYVLDLEMSWLVQPSMLHPNSWMVNNHLSQFLRNVERPALRPLLALLVVEAEVVVDEVDLQAQKLLR